MGDFCAVGFNGNRRRTGMKKLLAGIISVLSFIALPLMAQAAPLNYAGMVSGATVRYSTDIKTGANPQVLREKNTANTRNMLLTFDNVSGICRNGLMSFTRSGSGMWIGFGGAALAPTPTMFQGNLQCGGVITVSGNVTYRPAFNTYSGTGTVIEFIGTMPVNGVMRRGWAGAGQYGTPGAGPGGGWMPGFGNTSSIMPGWGGSTSNWGMMGGYGSGTVSPNPAGTGYMGGGGMMGGGGGPMPGMMGAGSGTGTGGGMMGASTAGTVDAAAVGGSRAGMMRSWVNPTAAAMITVTNGIPDHASPTSVLLSITMPAMQLRMMP
jgi:hypothetical protein